MEQEATQVTQATVSIKALLEAGAHFGHQTSRWNPKMKRYIFTQRNGIHIIDLQQTLVMLERAGVFVRELVAGGGTLLFVGTKKQAQEAVEQEAKRCGMFFVNRRWQGGMLTNFPTIQARIDYLVRLEDRKSRGEFEKLTKKEALKLDKEILRLNQAMSGFKEMTALPDAIFIVDPTKERIALAESKRMRIPVVAIVDTNCDPDGIDYLIPCNDDAIRALRLVCSRMATAVLEGKALSVSGKAEEEPAATAVPVEAAAGASTPQPTQTMSFSPEEDK